MAIHSILTMFPIAISRTVREGLTGFATARASPSWISRWTGYDGGEWG